MFLLVRSTTIQLFSDSSDSRLKDSGQPNWCKKENQAADQLLEAMGDMVLWGPGFFEGKNMKETKIGD